MLASSASTSHHLSIVHQTFSIPAIPLYGVLVTSSLACRFTPETPVLLVPLPLPSFGYGFMCCYCRAPPRLQQQSVSCSGWRAKMVVQADTTSGGRGRRVGGLRSHFMPERDSVRGADWNFSPRAKVDVVNECTWLITATITSPSPAAMPSVAKSRLVEVHPERVGAVSAPPDAPFDIQDFGANLTVQPTRLSSERIELDLIGVDASIANALRRILIAEVPTVAIEHVYIFNNTSIIQDEVLAHRLGLVPIQIDPDRIVYKNPGDEATEDNTLVFTLNIQCSRVQGAKKDEKDEEKKYINSNGEDPAREPGQHVCKATSS